MCAAAPDPISFRPATYSAGHQKILCQLTPLPAHYAATKWHFRHAIIQAWGGYAVRTLTIQAGFPWAAVDGMAEYYSYGNEHWLDYTASPPSSDSPLLFSPFR